MADTLVFTLLGIDKLSDVFDQAGKKSSTLGEKLDNLGTTGIKSMASLQGATLAAGAVAGGAVAGLALATAAAGVALVSNNAQVSKSFTDLGNDALSATRSVAQPMVAATLTATSSIRTMIGQAQPLLGGMFANAAPQLVEFTSGINRLALNALPGMATAVKNSGAAVAGASSLMASSGYAVGGFFREISAGSDAGGTALASLGRIVNTVLPAAGAGIAALAQAYTSHAPQVESAIANIVSVMGSLSGGSLPVLITAAGAALDVINGLGVVLGPIAGYLGGIVGVALSAGAAFKIVSAGADALKTTVATLSQFGTAARAATTGTAGLAGRMGGMVTMMGGPLGIAVAAAVTGLMLLGMAQQSAAEKAAKHTQFVQSLTTSLRESAGAIDFSTRKTVAADDAVKNMTKSGEQFGIKSGQIVDAVLGQGTALEQLRAKLGAVVEANKEYATTEADPNSLSWTGAYTDQGNAAKSLLDEINRLNGGTKEAMDAASKYGSSLASANSSMLTTTASGRGLAGAVTILKDTANDATSRIQALADAVDALDGESLSVQEAQAKVNAGLIQFADLASESTDRTKGWGDGLLNANGSINTLVPNGQSLFNLMGSLKTNAIGLAQSTYDMSRNMGDDIPTAMAKAKDSMQVSRDSVIALARDMDLSEDQAKALADQMGFLPSRVEIAMSTPMMTETQRELQILKSRVDDVPGAKSITVTSLSDEARKKLEDLGYTVVNLPDGRVRVDSNTDPAWAGLNAITQAKHSTTVTVNYVSVNRPTSTMTAWAPFAAGGLVFPMAAGGISNLPRIGDGSQASFMPKNDIRMMGDRKDVPELFAPLDGSVRTSNFLRMANQIEGLNTGGGTAVAVATTSVTNVTYVNAVFPNATDARSIQTALLNLKRDNGGGELGIA